MAANILHFARALRAAGLPVGPGRVVEAVNAVAVGGFEYRTDFYHTLAACFLSPIAYVLMVMFLSPPHGLKLRRGGRLLLSTE